LDARLANPKELSGLLNRALDALKALEESRGLLESEAMAAAADELRKITDPLAVWLDRYTVEKPEATIAKGALHVAYNAAANAEGRPVMTPTAFGRALKRLRPTVQDAQRTIGGRLQWAWVGLGMLETNSGMCPGHSVH